MPQCATTTPQPDSQQLTCPPHLRHQDTTNTQEDTAMCCHVRMTNTTQQNSHKGLKTRRTRYDRQEGGAGEYNGRRVQGMPAIFYFLFFILF